MIKAIIFLTKIVVVVCVAMLFSSCRYTFERDHEVNGNNDLKTETRTINENYEGISAENAIEVVVQQSDEKSVVIEAESNVLQHITTEVENGILVIRLEDHLIMHSTAKVTVSMPVIHSLRSESSSTIRSTNTLVTDNLEVVSESSSEIDINVEADAITLESSSSSGITVSGKALKLETSSSSSSEIDAKRLMANEVVAQANSASSTSVYPILSLEAEASSASSITYHKVPKSLSKQENSAGSISEE